jgi:hypothetical protein
MNRPFAWQTYKGCKIIGTARQSLENGHWTPKATVFWKRETEKHLTFLNGPHESFDNLTAAEDYAMSLAVNWCDENILGELVEAPRARLHYSKQRD